MIRQRFQGFLFWLASQQELRWWIRRAAVQLTDEPEERFRLLRLAASMGINGAVAFLLFSNFIMAPIQDAPLVGPGFDRVLPDEISIVPRAPGTDPRFALDFCNDPATNVRPPQFPVAEDVGPGRAVRLLLQSA